MLKTTILAVLSAAKTACRTLPKRLLKQQCELQLGSRIGDADFEGTITELQNLQAIDFTIDALTNDRKYHITAFGESLL